MPLHEITSPADAARYWGDAGKSYRNSIDSPYHRHRLAVIDALLAPLRLESSACLDFGCGDGLLLERLAHRGARVAGMDTDAQMIEAAQARIERARIDADASVGGIDRLATIPAQSFDHVLAINVITYFSDEQEEQFYRDVHRILRPGGSLVAMHSNELFDLYTLNAYTARFFARWFVEEDVAAAVPGLLTHPDRPQRVVHNIRENPLTYRHKLERFGFQELQQEFANFHDRPPQLYAADVGTDINAKSYPGTLGWPPEERWKLMFQCSMFGSRAARHQR